jgi:hypothetical protein
MWVSFGGEEGKEGRVKEGMGIRVEPTSLPGFIGRV